MRCGRNAERPLLGRERGIERIRGEIGGFDGGVELCGRFEYSRGTTWCVESGRRNIEELRCDGRS